jgi:AraC family transcriptional regulator
MAGFSSGQFYGAQAFERALPGVTLAHFAGTTPEHEVEEHSHDTAHLVLATRGRYISSAHGDIGDGPVLVYNPPGIVHRDRFAGDGGWFFAVSLKTTPDDLPGDAFRLGAPGAVRAAVRLLRSASDRDASVLELEALTHELTAEVRPLPVPPHCPSWLMAARSYIADMARFEIGIADVAAAAGVHPVYLARQYRRWLGYSPGHDLRRRRVELAASMIASHNAPLSEIALTAGFCDQSHLNRAFMAQWGLTPAEFGRLIGCKRPRQDDGQ